jgi:hypothetical protein
MPSPRAPPAALVSPRIGWLVTETAYGRVWGFRHFLTKTEARATARVWRSQNAGIVTVEQVEVPT